MANYVHADDTESNAFHNVEISGVELQCFLVNRGQEASSYGIAEVQDHEGEADKNNNGRAPAKRLSTF